MSRSSQPSPLVKPSLTSDSEICISTYQSFWKLPVVMTHLAVAWTFPLGTPPTHTYTHLQFNILQTKLIVSPPSLTFLHLLLFLFTCSPWFESCSRLPAHPHFMMRLHLKMLFLSRMSPSDPRARKTPPLGRPSRSLLSPVKTHWLPWFPQPKNKLCCLIYSVKSAPVTWDPFSDVQFPCGTVCDLPVHSCRPGWCYSARHVVEPCTVPRQEK